MDGEGVRDGLEGMMMRKRSRRVGYGKKGGCQGRVEGGQCEGGGSFEGESGGGEGRNERRRRADARITWGRRVREGGKGEIWGAGGVEKEKNEGE